MPIRNLHKSLRGQFNGSFVVNPKTVPYDHVFLIRDTTGNPRLAREVGEEGLFLATSDEGFWPRVDGLPEFTIARNESGDFDVLGLCIFTKDRVWTGDDFISELGPDLIDVKSLEAHGNGVPEDHLGTAVYDPLVNPAQKPPKSKL